MPRRPAVLSLPTESTMSRYASSAPAVYLRGALKSKWPEMRATAEAIILRAMAGRTREQAAEELEMSRSAFLELLKDFPHLREVFKKST